MNNDKQLTPVEKHFEYDYPTDGPEFVGSMFDVYEKGYNAAFADRDLMDKELDMLHELITELYNIDVCVSAIKLTLTRIKKLQDGK